MSEFFTGNRKKVMENLPNNSVLVLFSGNAPIKLGDEQYRFAVPRNFYYLTGIDSPNVILVLQKHGENIREFLYLERFDELKAKWIGAPLNADEAKKLSGVAECWFVDEFEKDISKLFLEITPEVWSDLESPASKFVEKLQDSFPDVKIQNVYPVFASLRAIKTEYEMNHIKKAIAITRDGFCSMMKNARAGMFEYEIEAFFDFTLKKNGVHDHAFPLIAASGANAAVLHYAANNRKICGGEMILVDAGAQFGCYNADITRTFPVNGKFSSRQKLLYNVVLEGQKRVIETIKPGVLFKTLNETLIDFYKQELKKIGLIENDDDMKKYYYHKVSHMLGLETHDCNRIAEKNDGTILEEGMVLTVEPGLYIAEEGIGIRIEDDVAVTKDGCEVLSAQIAKTTEEIESLIQGSI